jgi:hypothetical protein
MLRPLEGPRISLGKGIVMPIVKEPKKAAQQDATNGKKDSKPNKFQGKVVSITSNKLVMTNKEGKEYSHTFAKDAKFACGGKACKASDVKAGSEIRVTTKMDDRNVATEIEVISKSDKGEGEACCS